jgi:hypothetical protein
VASIYKAIKNFINIKQEEKESIAEFVKRFKIDKDIMEAQYGEIILQDYAKMLDGYDGLDDDIVAEKLEETHGNLEVMSLYKQSAKIKEES